MKFLFLSLLFSFSVFASNYEELGPIKTKPYDGVVKGGYFFTEDGNMMLRTKNDHFYWVVFEGQDELKIDFCSFIPVRNLKDLTSTGPVVRGYCPNNKPLDDDLFASDKPIHLPSK